LFQVACDLVSASLSEPVQSSLVSLGGFTAPRAEKYLKKKLFGFNPHYIVIQLAATDAACPIREGSRQSGLKSASSGASRLSAAQKGELVRSQRLSALSPLRWKLASLIGYIKKAQPNTPLHLYTAAMERMVDSCLASGITPVVLTPFVSGPRYAAKKAMPFTNALHDLASKKKGMILIDCVQLLEKYPRTSILLHDGFHLSELGQRLVGQAAGQAILTDINAKNLECAGDDGAGLVTPSG